MIIVSHTEFYKFSTVCIYLSVGSEKVVSTITIAEKELSGKVLLIPSIILTKGLISDRFKLAPGQMNDILSYLTEGEWIKSGLYVQCQKRKFEAYLKYVPKDIEDRAEKYSLQGRLLDVNVDVHQYIESLKAIQFFTSSQRPSDLLITTLQQPPYAQLNIDPSMEYAGKYTYDITGISSNSNP